MTSNEAVFLLFPALVLTIVATNFLQASGGANIFNFYVVSLTALNLTLSLVVAKLVSARRYLIFPVLLAGILAMVQSSSYLTSYLKNYHNGTDVVTIDVAHEEALSFLKNLPATTTILQTHPRHYLNSYSPYLYFFAGQKSYLGGINILESHNQEIADKQEVLTMIFEKLETASNGAQLATEAGISDILLSKQKDTLYLDLFYPRATFSATHRWRIVFENSDWLVIEPDLVKP